MNNCRSLRAHVASRATCNDTTVAAVNWSDLLSAHHRPIQNTPELTVLEQFNPDGDPSSYVKRTSTAPCYGMQLV